MSDISKVCECTEIAWDQLASYIAFPSNRQRQSYDGRLAVKREDYQNISMLCCAQHLCTVMHTPEQFLQLYASV